MCAIGDALAKSRALVWQAHNRFLYYLTVDDRMGDVMENVKDADLAMSKNKHNLLTLPDGRVVPGVRSGPDWSSYVSNWMTIMSELWTIFIENALKLALQILRLHHMDLHLVQIISTMSKTVT